MTQILYIHGAGASTRSFNFLREKLPPHEATFVTHDHDEALPTIVSRTRARLDGLTRDTFLVGHSLGGVIAFAAHHHPRVTRMVTICSPFGGSNVAELFRWVSSSAMFDNIRPEGRVLRDIRAIPLRVPHLAIVGCHSLPLSREPNDGVVTVASQTCIKGPVYHHLDISHSETLLDMGVVEMIEDFLFQGTA